MIGIADDIVVASQVGLLGAVGILPAPVPDRLAVSGDQHALVHVE